MSEELSLGEKASLRTPQKQTPISPLELTPNQWKAINASEADRIADAGVDLATDFIVGTQRIGEEAYLLTQPDYMQDYWHSLSVQEQNELQGGLSEIFREANREVNERRDIREAFYGEGDPYAITADVAKLVIPSLDIGGKGKKSFKLGKGIFGGQLGKGKNLDSMIKTTGGYGGFEFGLNLTANESLDDAMQNAIVVGAIGTAVTTPWKRTYKGISNQTANMVNGIIKSKQTIRNSAVTASLLAGTELEANPFSGLNKLFTPKVGIKSTTDIKKSIETNQAKYGEDLGTLEAERANVETLSEFQSPDRLDRVSKGLKVPNAEMLKGLGDEIIKEGRGRLDNEASALFDAVEDLTKKSHLETKLQPDEGLARVAENLKEITKGFDTPTAQTIRDTLGKTFRTGVNGDELIRLVTDREYIPNLIRGIKATDAELADIHRISNDLAELAHRDTAKLKFNAKGVKQSLINAGADLKFTNVVEELARAKAFTKLPMETKDAVSQIVRNNPDEVKDLFNYRNTIQANTKRLLKEGSLKQEDEIFAFTKRPTEDNLVRRVISKEDFEEFQRTEAFKNSVANHIPWLKRENRIKGTRDLGDSVEVVYKEKGIGEFLQGALPKLTKESRGVEKNILKDERFASEITDGTLDGLPVGKIQAQFFDENLKPIVNRAMPYDEYRAVAKKVEINFPNHQDMSKVLTVKEPLTPEMEKLLKRSTDIGDIVIQTVKGTQKQLGKESMFQEIKSKYSTTVGADNAKHFLDNYGTDPKYLFFKPESLDILEDARIMQTIANNFVKIDDSVMAKAIGARYVNKAYAHQLFGYNEMFSTVGKYGIPRAIEELWRQSVDIFRGAVVIKNPPALVNNMVSMMFMNFIDFYKHTGKINHKAFTKVAEAGRDYKQFKDLLDELAFARRNGLSTKTIELKLEANPAYQLYQEGGLQSLLDDGLINRGGRSLPEDNTIIRNVFLAEGSRAGDIARKMADMSDIMNRINGYKMFRDMGMSTAEASEEVTKISVNYSKLLEPSQMYGRANGIIPFMSWYSRMTPVMIQMFKDRPMRMAGTQAMYYSMVSTLGSENGYGDDYLGGVRVESYNPFNSLAPSNWADPVAGSSIFDPKTRIPAILTNDPSKLTGITTQ